jgi:hypothetical protein
MDVIARDVVADALRDEFAAWIAGHPNAAIFDWNVAAENVLRATTNQGAVEALTELVAAAEPFIRDEAGGRLYRRFLAAMVDARPYASRGQ